MAKAPKSFKIEANDKTIIIYTNVEPDNAEQKLINFYLNSGYTPLMEKKKNGITVEEMKKKLKKDEEAYNEFMRLYKSKETIIVEGKELSGFHAACRYYNEWNAKKNEK